MNEALEFARGPLFAATFLFMVLGLARHVLLRTVALVRTIQRSPPKTMPWMRIVSTTVDWLLPVKHVLRRTPVINVSSVLFHVGLILVPLFLADHIYLWSKGIGLSWPALGRAAADFLTLLTLLCTTVLLLVRLVHAPSRAMSSLSDYLHLLLIACVFATGYFASHPEWSLLEYETAMLIHVISAELVLVLLPFSKLSHAILFPFDRLAMDLFWRLVPGAGARVADELRGNPEGAEA